MASSLYADIDSLRYADIINKVSLYADENQMQIFMFRLPKSDLRANTYEHENCFMLMSVGYKVALIKGDTNNTDYEEYCEDVDEIIKYLYSKYEYRSELGRFSSWATPYIIRGLSITEINDLPSLWSKLKVTDIKDVKNTELLVTLCTGSINDIERVKSTVPSTVLDQVRQKIQAFDADQTRFIYQEIDKKLVKIQGLSGTGKTELLLHKLKELYQKSNDSKIFVTCHNKILADSLRNRIPSFFNFMKVTHQIEWEERLWCTHAWGGMSSKNSGLYRYLCDYYNLNFYPYRMVASFDIACQLAIKQLKEKFKETGISPALDYIIVDECQDFKDSFFELCQLVTSRQVYIAGDVFQSIFAEDLSKSYSADFFLTKCYRTDPKTLMFAHGLGLGLFEEKRLRWLTNEDWESCGYTCSNNNSTIILKREPVRRFLDVPDDYESIVLKPYNGDSLYSNLCSEISKIKEENPTCTVDDFCVILLDSDQNIYVTANYIESLVMKYFGWEVNKAYETKKKIPNTLLISNKNNVKGLEYPFVICITKKITFNYTYRNSIYTMLTRSFLKTILFLPNKGSGINQTILDGYNEIMRKHQMTIRIPSEDERKDIETRFQAAKRKKPFSELLKELILKMGIEDPAEKDSLYNSANYMGWEDLSEDELAEKLKSLNDLR